MTNRKEIVKKNPKDICYKASEIISLLREAKIASSKRRSFEAIFFYDEVLKQEPENNAAWWGKGCEYLYLRVNENTEQYLKEEIKCYEKILSLNDEEMYYFTWYERAMAHEELGQKEEAILCHARFLELCDYEDNEDIADGARSRIIQLSEEYAGRIEKADERITEVKVFFH